MKILQLTAILAIAGNTAVQQPPDDSQQFSGAHNEDFSAFDFCRGNWDLRISDAGRAGTIPSNSPNELASSCGPGRKRRRTGMVSTIFIRSPVGRCRYEMPHATVG